MNAATDEDDAKVKVAEAELEKFCAIEIEGVFVKVDLEYPDHLHDEHNDYPLACERMRVRDDKLSPYQTDLKEKLNITSDQGEKLVPNLNDKKGYVCDIRALKFYKEHGLIVSKVHRVLTFKQRRWLAPYIMFNTMMRKKAKNKFEKDFYKLMSNAVFGKTMENLRKRVDMVFLCSNSDAWGDKAVSVSAVAKRTASPFMEKHIIGILRAACA